jgi:hypothetical protein
MTAFIRKIIVNCCALSATKANDDNKNIKVLYMSLSANSKQVLLQALYYGKTTQFTSIKSLYDAVKNKGITYEELRDFIQSQESSQLFKKPRKVKHYYPIFAKHKFEILQLDLADLSNLASANKNYKYLLIAIDVFSRLLFVVPMKNKSTSTILDAVEEIFDQTEPTMINTDNGSEFISKEFKKLLKERGIDVQYSDVGDHYKMGLIDRVVRTLREKINKYMEMHETTHYIDVLPKIVENYNLAYHSGIKKAPAEVEEDDQDILNIMSEKYSLAKREETIYQVGDKVRYIINFKQFQKHTLPHWTKTIHEIKSHVSAHSYLLDNGQIKKYYELQLVPSAVRMQTVNTGPTREQLNKERKIAREWKKTGLEKENILTSSRTRKRTDRLKSS